MPIDRPTAAAGNRRRVLLDRLTDEHGDHPGFRA